MIEKPSWLDAAKDFESAARKLCAATNEDPDAIGERCQYPTWLRVARAMLDAARREAPE